MEALFFHFKSLHTNLDFQPIHKQQKGMLRNCKKNIFQFLKKIRKPTKKRQNINNNKFNSNKKHNNNNYNSQNLFKVKQEKPSSFNLSSSSNSQDSNEQEEETIREPENVLEAKRQVEMLYCDFIRTFLDNEKLSYDDEIEDLLHMIRKFFQYSPINRSLDWFIFEFTIINLLVLLELIEKMTKPEKFSAHYHERLIFILKYLSILLEYSASNEFRCSYTIEKIFCFVCLRKTDFLNALNWISSFEKRIEYFWQPLTKFINAYRDMNNLVVDVKENCWDPRYSVAGYFF